MRWDAFYSGFLLGCSAGAIGIFWTIIMLLLLHLKGRKKGRYIYRFKWEHFDTYVEEYFLSKQRLSEEEFRDLCTTLYREAAKELLNTGDYISDWQLSEIVIEKLKERGFTPLKPHAEFRVFGSPDESIRDLAEEAGIENSLPKILGEDLVKLIESHNKGIEGWQNG